MDDFNFSNLMPVQQGAVGMSIVSTGATSSMIIPTEHGREEGSVLTLPGKSDETTMYITVDTGPPSAPSHPQLGVNCSPPSFSTIPNLLNPFKTEEIESALNINGTAIASLIIDSHADAGGSFPSTFSALVSPPTSDLHSSGGPSNMMLDNSLHLTGVVKPRLSSASCKLWTNHFERESTPLMSVNNNNSQPSHEVVLAASASPSLFCGECSVNLSSSADFFDHWVAHHCQLQPTLLLQNQTNSNTIEVKQAADDFPNSERRIGSNTGGIVMDRCSVCNHIFVQGTDRHKQHSHSGSCVSAVVSSASRNSVDAVNNNHSPSIAEMRIMVPFPDHRVMNASGNGLPNVPDVQLPNLPKVPLTVAPVMMSNVVPNKRKLDAPKTAHVNIEVPEKVKRPETATNSKNCVCGTCNTSVKTITSYFLHWLEHHQNDPEHSNNTMAGVRRSSEDCSSPATNILQEVWQCRACPSNITKLFPDCVALSVHVNLEHGVGTALPSQHLISSNNCSMTFGSKENLEKHERNFHVEHRGTRSEKQILSCPLCGENLHAAASLCEHYRCWHVVQCKGTVATHIHNCIYCVLHYY